MYKKGQNELEARMDYNWYLYKTYSAWLGKNIGIRLGAPVEGWTYEQILEKYGKLNGYPLDYGIFAADDDSNGPAVFVRALEGRTPRTLTAEDIGETFLNYIKEYEGFFWWGGLGISSEHTAYENLKNGIRAPESGSEKTNGIVIAEQIGGQIFSDCWGYVSGCDPQLAKELASKAASVTHDGNGIQGAIFVAVAICLAYTEKDCVTILEKTLEYLDPEMEYCRVAQDLLRFYREHPGDWHVCFDYIRATYGYEKYPGVCHIIPNMALMVMAMCYGENDFSKTLLLLCQCGWDTDCNCGNVGSILGAMAGLEGIGERWIAPLNDILNLSTAIGCLNIETISGTSRMFANLAFQMDQPEKKLPDPLEMEFDLPYASNGFWKRRTKTGTEFYKYTYFRGNDLYDSRYDPSFSPLVYPGDTLCVELECKDRRRIRLFCVDCADQYQYDNLKEVCGASVLTWRIPEAEDNTLISRIGLEIDAGEELNGSENLGGVLPISVNDPDRTKPEIRLRKVSILPGAKFSCEFKNYPLDTYGPRFGGGSLDHLRGLVDHSGEWRLEGGALRGEAKDHALITTGRLSMKEYSLHALLRPLFGDGWYLVFHCRGYRDFYGAGLENGRLQVCRWYHGRKEVLTAREYSGDREYISLGIDVHGSQAEVTVGGNRALCLSLQERNPSGIVGLYLEAGSACDCFRIALQETNNKEEKR